MTTEEVVRAALKAYAEKDMETAMGFVAETARFRNQSCGALDVWRFDGQCKADFATDLATINEAFEILDYELLDIIASGTRAATRQRVVLKRRGVDGPEVTTVISGFWNVEDGKVTELHEFQDTAMVAREMAR